MLAETTIPMLNLIRKSSYCFIAHNQEQGNDIDEGLKPVKKSQSPEDFAVLLVTDQLYLQFIFTQSIRQ
jgi:hypothetical protein